MTKREKNERAYKKNLLDLAKKHDKAGEVEKVQRYHMPSKDRKECDTFVEADEREKQPNYEQKRWEEEHLHSAVMKFGAKDAKVIKFL